MSDFQPNCPSGIDRGFGEEERDPGFWLRCEYLPIPGTRPIEFYVGDRSIDQYELDLMEEGTRPAEAIHALLTVEQFRRLVDTLQSLCEKWEEQERLEQ